MKTETITVIIPCFNEEEAREGHPDTGSPQIKVRTMITMIMTKETRQNKSPSTDASDNGATENPVIPSMEYTNSFLKDHFVSPARSERLVATLSYSSSNRILYIFGSSDGGSCRSTSLTET